MCRERRIHKEIEKEWPRRRQRTRSVFSNPREEGIPGRAGITEKLCGEVFNGTGCGNTGGAGRAGKKRYGFWIGKY